MPGMTRVKATVLDDDRFRLLAIPFGGPIPSRVSPRGVDLEGEWFSERTDIKADWLPVRMVDWHHRMDPTGVMGEEVIGKAGNLRMDEDGWWVDVWLDFGKQRTALVRRLAERGGELFGSSQAAPGMVRTEKATGEILVWPYWRQALSTSPVNTLSVIRPLKATLTDIADGTYAVGDEFWSELQDALGDLGSDLREGAKAGRVLSGVNERALMDALEGLDGAVDRLREVLDRARQRQTEGGQTT